VSEPFETIALPPASRARDAWRLAGGLWLLARAATAPDRTAGTVLGQLCALAVEVVPADGAGVSVVDDDGRLRAVHARPAVLLGIERHADGARQDPRHAAVARRAAVTVDILADAARWPGMTQAYTRAGMQSALAMPLVAGDRVRGVLTLYRSAPQPWTEHDLLVASVLTDVAAAHLMTAADGPVRDPVARTAPAGVTGLPGGDLLVDRLRHALVSARRRRSSVAVLIVGVDGYPAVDEVLGRAAGDAVLVEVADRLAHALRSDDTLGHLGGGEFLVVCEDLTGSPARLDRQLRALGDRICRRLRESADGGGRQAMVSVSIGASVGADPDEAQELIDAATRALVAATRAGAGRLVVSGADVPDVVTLADYRSARRTPAGR